MVSFWSSFVVLLAIGAAPAPSDVGWQRCSVGEIQVMALLDGEIELPPALLQGIPSADAATFLGGKGAVVTSVNAFLVPSGAHLVLVDTGSGTSEPGQGHLIEPIRLAGCDPAAVEAWFLTHLHDDHFGGLLTADGQRAFPNAVVYVSRAEAAYWLGPAAESKLPGEW